MECEMCGKPATMVATVEGTQMTVCASCGAYGKPVRQLAPAAKERITTRKPVWQPPKEPELVESVHPDIAHLLRSHRERVGLTQEQFAQRHNLRTSLYQHYESGKAVPDIATARKLEHALKQPLVVKLKITGTTGTHETQGMTLGDMMKKK